MAQTITLYWSRAKERLKTISRSAAIVLSALAFATIAPPASTDDAPDAKEIAIQLGHRYAAFDSLISMERLAARLNYVYSTALVAHHGDWPNEVPGDQAEETENFKFFRDVYYVRERFPGDLIALKRAVGRKGTFTEDELGDVNVLLDQLAQLISRSEAYHELLIAARIDEANQFYKDDLRQLYLDIVSGSYTLSTEVSRDIRSMVLSARMIK